MAYYYYFPYEFTDHSIDRCRQRLKLGTSDNFLVKQKVIDLINKSSYQFEAQDTLYIRAKEGGNLFFVINKSDKVIITCAPVSIEKQMSLILKEEYN